MHEQIKSGKTALVCGISGQDGAYLAAYLLGLGYRVVGTSRDVKGAPFDSLVRLGIIDQVEVVPMSLNDFRSTMEVISRFEPDEIYNLAGQTSVVISFEQPVETFESIAIGTVNLLETIRRLQKRIRFFNAGSAEVFGTIGVEPARVTTALRPKSPYGIAKATSFWQIAQYREAYGIEGCTGVLFNHESPLRSERFVTQKIAAAACRIAAGSSEPLRLGDLSVRRDWGWAPEYVVAMHRMLQLDDVEDFVIATGRTSTLEDFVAEAFRTVGRDWREHVVYDPSLKRVNENRCGKADTSHATERLGWTARYSMPDVARMMVEARLGATQTKSQKAA